MRYCCFIIYKICFVIYLVIYFICTYSAIVLNNINTISYNMQQDKINNGRGAGLPVTLALNWFLHCFTRSKRLNSRSVVVILEILCADLWERWWIRLGGSVDDCSYSPWNVRRISHGNFCRGVDQRASDLDKTYP